MIVWIFSDLRVICSFLKIGQFRYNLPTTGYQYTFFYVLLSSVQHFLLQAQNVGFLSFPSVTSVKINQTVISLLAVLHYSTNGHQWDYLFGHDLKCIGREITKTLLCNFALFSSVCRHKFVLTLFITSLSHFCSDKPRTAHSRTRRRSVNVTDHQFRMVHLDDCFMLYGPLMHSQPL